jgi:phosphohistidine phosphatase
MKRAIFVRHAKSSWKYPELQDIERPLNKRGLRDGPVMARKMSPFAKDLTVVQPAAQDHAILSAFAREDTIILTSPANRALSTARFFAIELKIPLEEIGIIDELYMASKREVINILESINSSSDCAIIFGHNPTQTSLINYFGKDIDNVPTCGAFVVDSESETWKDFTDHDCTIKAYYYPKMFI